MSFFGNGLVKNRDGTDLITRMNFGLISEKKKWIGYRKEQKERIQSDPVTKGNIGFGSNIYLVQN